MGIERCGSGWGGEGKRGVSESVIFRAREGMMERHDRWRSESWGLRVGDGWVVSRDLIW